MIRIYKEEVKGKNYNYNIIILLKVSKEKFNEQTNKKEKGNKNNDGI